MTSPPGRLTPAADEALHLAEYEARGGGQAYVGDGHLLFGLAAGRAGIAAETLAAAGVTTDAVRKCLRPVMARERGCPTGRLPSTPRLTKVVASAQRADGAADAGSLLAALLEEREGVAFVVLARIAGHAAVRAELARRASVRPPAGDT